MHIWGRICRNDIDNQPTQKSATRGIGLSRRIAWLLLKGYRRGYYCPLLETNSRISTDGRDAWCCRAEAWAVTNRNQIRCRLPRRASKDKKKSTAMIAEDQPDWWSRGERDSWQKEYVTGNFGAPLGIYSHDSSAIKTHINHLLQESKNQRLQLSDYFVRASKREAVRPHCQLQSKSGGRWFQESCGEISEGSGGWLYNFLMSDYWCY